MKRLGRFAWLLFLAPGCGGGGGSGSPTAEPVGPVSPPPEPVEAALTFELDTASSFSRSFGSDTPVSILEIDPELFGGGFAAADVDADGDVDFYVVGGNTMPNHFYRNRGDGTFEEIGVELGLDLVHWGSGPAFGDIDGDGDLDLFVGAVVGDPHHLFENRLDESGRFVDVTDESGIRLNARNTVSATFFDYDRDGWIDLFLSHWGNPYEAGKSTQTVWRNNGDGSFVDTSIETGLAGALVERETDWSFTPNFSDIDGDGDADLLLAADFHESKVFLNNDDGTFTNVTNRRVIQDQAGMGAAVGDYDNDGDMDWFVTSIYDLDLLDGDYLGNFLYRNDDGEFEDATLTGGVQDGAWGWGACTADFENDGNLDILHVNGWYLINDKDYRGHPVRFFQNTGSRLVFRETAAQVGLTDDSQGRGVACLDVDRDGDVDVLISNNDETNVVLYRNETTNDNHYLVVRLEGIAPNRLGIGSRITVTTTDGAQIRDLGGLNNYVSHGPYEVHFGLAQASTADVDVRWPDGTTSTTTGVSADQLLTIRQPATNLRLVVLQGAGDGVYDEGDVISVEAAEAADGYHFSHWSTSGGGVFADASEANTTFTMPDMTVTITAHYLPGVGPDADVSAPRRWVEVLLQAIRNDYARPTVHARNLFHVSAAMFDAWAAYDVGGADSSPASPWLYGRTRAGSACASGTLTTPEGVDESRQIALSYAVYRLIRHRFDASPGASQIVRDADALMGYLGHDMDYAVADPAVGPAALGNHIGQCYIDFGFVDGANEANDYANVAYVPVNEALEPSSPGNPNITDLNRWQPLALEEFVDQAGNPSDSEPEFLGPEWGSVVPFALREEDLTIHERDGFDYWVYHDPGPPPLIDVDPEEYKWSHSLVAVWSSHLDPTDGVTMDISPASVGNVTAYPGDFNGHRDFYRLMEGGDPGVGHAVNPATGEAYQPQVVPRGDYTRVLAEFWADGPDSETPPGHWFVILNEVNDHPLMQARFRGEDALDLLEYDVKAYFMLGGAMHDAAIAAWGIKGYYDYVRPISSLRAMADRGQSSDPDGESYHVDGIPLRPGYIELVDAGDALAGDDQEHVGKIKFLAWLGPDAIDDPEVDVAGVDWMLAENWWPYQRPTFVTPPFAGYVSGHSTYSRAAAEVLTALTEDEFFPGGMSDFEIEANEFLVFEDGPSVNMTLQWATYRDASDQCSLSRIWGGIHPPADDIAGRLIGIEVGIDAFELAERHFSGEAGEID